MKVFSLQNLIIPLFALLLFACASGPQMKIVTLVGKNGDQFIGNLNYDGPYSGTLIVEKGPNSESFSGRFNVVDKTAVEKNQGALVVPQAKQFPAIGAVEGASSGNVDATGFWYAMGDKGSKMECELQVGRGGHGHGICKHSNGMEYKIVL